MFYLYVDHKIQEAIGDMYCPTCETEKCVDFASSKTSSFHDCEKCKHSQPELKVPFKEQRSTLTFLVCDLILRY